MHKQYRIQKIFLKPKYYCTYHNFYAVALMTNAFELSGLMIFTHVFYFEDKQKQKNKIKRMMNAHANLGISFVTNLYMLAATLHALKRRVQKKSNYSTVLVVCSLIF